MTSQEIKTLRESMGLNREQFGKLIGVGYYSVQSYELGRKTPSPSVMLNIERLNGEKK